jgi:hypothetical protein
MKIIYQLKLIVTAIVLFQSCQKEIEFDSKLIAPKMVINGFIQQDSLISITIGTSKTIAGVNKPNVWIDDATVKLFVDGEEKETLSTFNIADYSINFYNSNSPQTVGDSTHLIKCYRSQSIKAETGKTYKLVVSHPNYKTVTCETTIPQSVIIESIDTIYLNDSYDGYANYKLKIKIKFKDPSGEKNYYRLVYKRLVGYSYPKNYDPKDTTTMIVVSYEEIGTQIDSEDPIINPSEKDANDLLFGSSSNTFNIFTDDLIKGKEHELSFNDFNYAYNPSEIDTSINEFFMLNIDLQSITHEAYLYMKSVGASNYYSNDLFSEPIPIFTNIENGIGIFAGYSSSLISISKGKYPINGVKYQFDNIGYINNKE